MNLSQHFTLAELTKTGTGLPNSAPAHIHSRLVLLANTLEKVRALFCGRAVLINSAYRSPAVNKAVGGSATSAHCMGYAADFTVDGVSVSEVCRVLAATPTIQFDQLIDEKRNGGSGWVHLSIDPRMRRQLRTFRNGTYSEGLPR